MSKYPGLERDRQAQCSGCEAKRIRTYSGGFDILAHSQEHGLSLLRGPVPAVRVPWNEASTDTNAIRFYRQLRKVSIFSRDLRLEALRTRSQIRFCGGVKVMAADFLAG